MADGGQSGRLDLDTAEELSAALTAIANVAPPGSGQSASAGNGVSGLLTVRFNGHHMVCHYDAAIADVDAWDRNLRQQLGDSKAQLVRYQPAATSPTDLRALLERVMHFAWHPRAASFGLAAAIDWQREVLDITTEASATDEVAQTLIQLVGAQAVVTTGARFPRRTGPRR